MAINDFTVEQLCESLGERLKRARLESNITQSHLAKDAGVSLSTIKNAEKGSSTLESVVRILIALNLIEQLDIFIPEQKISPIEILNHSKKKVRQRASNNSSAQSSEEW